MHVFVPSLVRSLSGVTVSNPFQILPRSKNYGWLTHLGVSATPKPLGNALRCPIAHGTQKRFLMVQLGFIPSSRVRAGKLAIIVPFYLSFRPVCEPNIREHMRPGACKASYLRVTFISPFDSLTPGRFLFCLQNECAVHKRCHEF